MEISIIREELLHFMRQNIVSEDVDLKFDTALNKVGIDSYSIVEIILFIERKFNVTLSDSQLVPSNFLSINSIAELVSDGIK